MREKGSLVSRDKTWTPCLERLAWWLSGPARFPNPSWVGGLSPFSVGGFSVLWDSLPISTDTQLGAVLEMLVILCGQFCDELMPHLACSSVLFSVLGLCLTWVSRMDGEK